MTANNVGFLQLPAELARVYDVVSREGGLIDSTRRVSADGSVFSVSIATMGNLEELHANIRRTSGKATGVEMAGGGGGVNPSHAEAIAIIEAIERYSSSVPVSDLHWASQNELGLEAVDVRTLPQCSETELRHPKCLTKAFDPDERIRWTKAWSFTADQPRWIPAVSTWLHLPPLTASERFTLPISTGCAAHTNKSKALVNAICEVIERDSIALTWLQQLPLHPIVFDDGPQELFEALEDANRSGRKHRFFDATTDVGIPTVYCVDTNENHKTMRHVVMCATDLDPAKAVIKIIREIASSRIGLEQGQPMPEDIDDFHGVFHGAQYMGAPDRARSFDFLLESKSEPRKMSDIPSLVGRSADEELAFLLDRLDAHGSDVYAADISTAESIAVGILVVRVLIPQLMPLSFAHRSRFLAHPRLYSAPAAMGFQVLPESEVNADPQPFA